MISVLAHLFTPQHSNHQRPRILHPEGFVVLIAIALSAQVLITKLIPVTPFEKILGYSSSITASQVLEETNTKRKNEGLPPLTLNKKLSNAAVAKATYMFDHQYWSHTAPDGTTPWTFIQKSGYSYSIAGENLARDFGDISSMISAWMNSPTHRANILQKKYSDIGIAVVDGKLQGVETTLVVQMFGSPSVVQAKTSDEGATHTFSNASVLADVSTSLPMYSPHDLTRAVSFAIVLLLVYILAYDMVVARRKNLVRIVGKNLAHILLFSVIFGILLISQGGLLL